MTSAARPPIDVVDEPSRQRYEGRIDGNLVGFIEYRAVRGRVILVHTEVLPSAEGQGVGTRLVTATLEDIRRRGLRITVKCPFVAAFLERHPEYRELVVRPGGRPAENPSA